jgi:hypothetical protein
MNNNKLNNQRWLAKKDHDPQNGFDEASKDFATNCPPSSVGKHASSFDTPREDIGNVAKDN